MRRRHSSGEQFGRDEDLFGEDPEAENIDWKFVIANLHQKGEARLKTLVEHPAVNSRYAGTASAEFWINHTAQGYGSDFVDQSNREYLIEHFPWLQHGSSLGFEASEYPDGFEKFLSEIPDDEWESFVDDLDTLDNYPLLDEQRHSELEMAELDRWIKEDGADELRKELKESDEFQDSFWQFAIDKLPLSLVYDHCRDTEWITEGDSVFIRMEKVAEDLIRENLLKDQSGKDYEPRLRHYFDKYKRWAWRNRLKDLFISEMERHLPEISTEAYNAFTRMNDESCYQLLLMLTPDDKFSTDDPAWHTLFDKEHKDEVWTITTATEGHVGDSEAEAMRILALESADLVLNWGRVMAARDPRQMLLNLESAAAVAMGLLEKEEEEEFAPGSGMDFRDFLDTTMQGEVVYRGHGVEIYRPTTAAQLNAVAEPRSPMDEQQFERYCLDVTPYVVVSGVEVPPVYDDYTVWCEEQEFPPSFCVRHKDATATREFFRENPKVRAAFLSYFIPKAKEDPDRYIRILFDIGGTEAVLPLRDLINDESLPNYTFLAGLDYAQSGDVKRAKDLLDTPEVTVEKDGVWIAFDDWNDPDIIGLFADDNRQDWQAAAKSVFSYDNYDWFGSYQSDRREAIGDILKCMQPKHWETLRQIMVGREYTNPDADEPVILTKAMLADWDEHDLGGAIEDWENDGNSDFEEIYDALIHAHDDAMRTALTDATYLGYCKAVTEALGAVKEQFREKKVLGKDKSAEELVFFLPWQAVSKAYSQWKDNSDEDEFSGNLKELVVAGCDRAEPSDSYWSDIDKAVAADSISNELYELTPKDVEPDVNQLDLPLTARDEPEPQQESLLFVYGTLASGEEAHERMKGAVNKGKAKTAAKYLLTDYHGSVGLKPGGDQSVEGELYEVDAPKLRELDDWEYKSFARRSVMLDDGRKAQAYVLAQESVQELLLAENARRRLVYGPRHLYHLTFDANLRGGYDLNRAGERGGTMYGAALNVTTEPDAWEVIAKLGGATVMRVKLPVGARLVDVYASFKGPPEKQRDFMRWASERHANEVIDAYRTVFPGEEGEYYSDFSTYEEAQAEHAAQYGDDETVPEADISRVVTVNEKVIWKLFFEFIRESYDRKVVGLWFQDELDPAGYSAPHGVIFDVSDITFSPVRSRADLEESKLPKGYRVVLVSEQGQWGGHVWKEGRHVGETPALYPNRDQARAAAISLAHEYAKAALQQESTPGRGLLAVQVDGQPHFVLSRVLNRTQDKFGRLEFPFTSWLTAWQHSRPFTPKSAQQWVAANAAQLPEYGVRAYAFLPLEAIGDGNNFDDLAYGYDWRLLPVSTQEAKLKDTETGPHTIKQAISQGKDWYAPTMSPTLKVKFNVTPRKSATGRSGWRKNRELPPMESVADEIAKEADKAETPSEDQKESGNYKKGHIRLNGFEIAIENAKGSTRSGENDEGEKWSVVLPAHYGYIKGTVGKDKDHLDVYIGEYPSALLVFIVNQQKEKGGFDEHKVLMGFKTKDEAIAAYDAAFTGDLGPKLRESVYSVTVDEFKAWVEKGDTKKPFKPLVEDLLEAMSRRDFLQRLGFGAAAVTAAPALSLLPQVAPDLKPAKEPYYADDYFSDFWDCLNSDPFFQKVLRKAQLLRVDLDEFSKAIWDSVSAEVQDAIDDYGDDPDVVKDRLWELANDVLTDIELNLQDIEGVRMDRRRELRRNADKEREARRQKNKSRKPRTVYTSRQGGQDRRELGPVRPYQGQPRWGESVADSLGLKTAGSMPEVVVGGLLDESPVAWHASPNRFTKFDTSREGSHFGTREQADNLRKPGKRAAKPYQVGVEHPLRIRDLGVWTVDGIVTELHGTGVISDAEADEVYAERNWADERAYAKIKEILKSKGYDGFVYANEQEGEGDSYVAFYSDQIKPIKESQEWTYHSGWHRLRHGPVEFKIWNPDNDLQSGAGKEDQRLVQMRLWQGRKLAGGGSWSQRLSTLPSFSCLLQRAQAHYETVQLRPEAREALYSIHESKATLLESYDYGCLMLEAPKEQADFVQQWGATHIPEESVYNDEEGNKGREGETHVTVLWGIELNAPNDEMRDLVGRTKIFPVKLGKIGLFKTNPDYDVVKIEVESPWLRSLNTRLRGVLPNKQTHPDYRPHCTVAYVKKGTCDALEGQAMFGEDAPLSTFYADQILFKGPGDDNRVAEYLPLLKEE